MTITDLCKELNNWFDTSKYFGRYTIANGSIDLSDMATDGSLLDGQYFRIVGSKLNDGVYQYPAEGLKDETFDGAIWAMAVPEAVISLLASITDWETKYADANNTPYLSESFGGYSYSKSSGTSGAGITALDKFAAQLKNWRKIRP